MSFKNRNLAGNRNYLCIWLSTMQIDAKCKKQEYHTGNTNYISNNTYFIVFFAVAAYFVNVVSCKCSNHHPKKRLDMATGGKHLHGQGKHNVVYRYQEKRLGGAKMPALINLFGEHRYLISSKST